MFNRYHLLRAWVQAIALSPAVLAHVTLVAVKTILVSVEPIAISLCLFAIVSLSVFSQTITITVYPVLVAVDVVAILLFVVAGVLAGSVVVGVPVTVASAVGQYVHNNKAQQYCNIRIRSVESTLDGVLDWKCECHGTKPKNGDEDGFCEVHFRCCECK
jgi:hypothetical protein